MRHMIVFEMDYIQDNADPKVSATAFQKKLMESIKKTGLLFMTFYKLIHNVKLIPLCKTPIPPVPQEPEKKAEIPPPEEKKRLAYDTKAVYPFKPVNHTNSLDDFPTVWSLFFYEKNIEQLSHETKTIGALLVCILQQIGADMHEPIPSKLNSPEELQNLFQNAKENLLLRQALGITAPEKQKDVEHVVAVGENVKSPYHIIFDEHDSVRSQYYGEKIFNESVSPSEIELGILLNLLTPGKDRHMMPSPEVKSKAVRGAIRSEMQAFATLPIYEFDRALILSEFEKMFASSNPHGEWNFGDRKYEERLSKEILVQMLSNYLLFSPDLLTSYYELDDNLLVGLYYQSPPGRILHKQWKGKFIHLPDYPNYRRFFAEAKDPPQELLDIDDGKVGEISERTKFMYPSDNSVIRVSKKQIGQEELPSVNILKDNYMFGLRKDLKPNVQKCDFWLNFENGTKLMVKMQPLFCGDDPKKAEGAVATLTFPCGLIVKFTGTGDIVQIRSENICKEPVKVEEVAVSPSIKEKKETQYKELHRVITGKGTVLKYMENGTIDALMANGNTSEYKEGLWVGVNNKGKRRGRKSNEFEMDTINCVSKTDPETQARVTLRQDGVVTVKYKDGRLLTKHKDETTMLTSPNGLGITVEKEGFAPVKVRLDPVKMRSNSIISRGGTDALLGIDDVMVRSNNGYLSTTYLPDGTYVQTYKEKQQLDSMDSFSLNTIHLIRRPDGGVIKVKEDGEVVVITPQQRVALNEQGQRKELGQDIDYFYELYGVPTERKSGVYTVRCNLGKIFTIDNEGNKFYLYANGITRERIAVSFALDNVQEEEPLQPASPVYQGSSYVDEQSRFLPAPK